MLLEGSAVRYDFYGLLKRLQRFLSGIQQPYFLVDGGLARARERCGAFGAQALSVARGAVIAARYIRSSFLASRSSGVGAGVKSS